jgi:hypothetical protein
MALVAGVEFDILRAVLALVPGLARRHPIKKWAAECEHGLQRCARRIERGADGPNRCHGAALAHHRLIVFQHFRIDQCGNTEFVHRAIRTPHRCRNK